MVSAAAAAGEDDRDLKDGVLEFDGEDGGDDQGDGAGEPEAGEPESQEVKTGPFAYKPTPAEVELHRLTHWPYRSWCEWCIKGKAIGEQHVRSTHVSDVPVVGADYFFLTSGDGDVGVNIKLRNEIDMDDSTMDTERREGRLVKCLIFRCHMSKAVFTWAVPYKGDGEDGYVTGLVATALK